MNQKSFLQPRELQTETRPPPSPHSQPTDNNSPSEHRTLAPESTPAQNRGGRPDPGACAPGLPMPQPAATPDVAPTHRPFHQIVGIPRDLEGTIEFLLQQASSSESASEREEERRRQNATIVSDKMAAMTSS